MKKYEILEHKADFKIRAFGKTKEELFLNVLLGMNAGLQPETKNEKSEVRKIKIQSLDLAALLVDFLSEALYLTQINQEVYHEVKIIKLSETEIEAELSGWKIKRFKEDIKAVTHHNLELFRNKDGIWQATILFDI